jgi:hypothetical protein
MAKPNWNAEVFKDDGSRETVRVRSIGWVSGLAIYEEVGGELPRRRFTNRFGGGIGLNELFDPEFLDGTPVVDEDALTDTEPV